MQEIKGMHGWEKTTKVMYCVLHRSARMRTAEEETQSSNKQGNLRDPNNLITSTTH